MLHIDIVREERQSRDKKIKKIAENNDHPTTITPVLNFDKECAKVMDVGCGKGKKERCT